MTGEKSIEGPITAISDKRKNGKDKGYGVLIGPEAEKNWINFNNDVLPGWIEKDMQVYVTFTENKGFKNGKNITKSDTPGGGGKTEKAPEVSNGGFKTAGSIDNVDRIIGGCADVATRCIEAFREITGNSPVTDGEFAVVNTMQIQAHKHISSGMIIKIAEKKANGHGSKK